ncbi:MAG TPA: GAF domain-containing protein, partial [Longimicrobiales bacterium]
MPFQTQDAHRDAERQRFLAEASHLLGSTLDYTETLRRLTRLAVPRIADWCAILMADNHGELQPVEVAHTDPAKVELAMELRRRFPPDKNDKRGAYEVLRTGRSIYVREIPDEMLTAERLHPHHLQLLRDLGLRSIMTVPLRARGRTFGVIQFVSAESGRLFDNDDVSFAEDFATRAAFAADNARLFQAARKRQKEEMALRRATEAVTATFSVEEIIDQIAHSALEATDADGSYVERIIDGDVRVVAAAGGLPPPLGEGTPYKGSVAERILDIGQPEVIRSLAESPRPLPGILAQTHAHAGAL